MNTVPPYHTLMLPLLNVMGSRNEMTTKQTFVIQRMDGDFFLEMET
mgnify:CR=1 FL=1|jgi:hypothetical protein